jgi:hypothetical protein
VIHNHPIANRKSAAARTNFDDQTTGLMPGNHSLITFRAFAQVLVINATNVRTANSGSFDPEQNFPMFWMRHWQSAKFNSIVSGKKCGLHGLLDYRHVVDP